MHLAPPAPRHPGTVLAALLLVVSLGAQGQDPPRFTDKVDVARILLDVRAIDPHGRPLLGLEPADFEVKIDGRIAHVESVQHITGAPAANPSAATASRVTEPQLATRGRLVVFLFQNSLERSRTPGLMRMLFGLKRSLDTLSPRDQVAVLRFDSRLQLLLDFTQDRDLLRRAFDHDVLFGPTASPGVRQLPSLRPVLDQERDQPSWSMEHSLLRIAEALTPLPGAKSVVVVGHGFGRFGSMGVLLDSDYDDAREALQVARASVFCLDVTEADYHSLEAGLKVVAADTGGLYQRTHIFSQAALDRVMAALEGQYVLFVEKPELRRGTHALDVRLKGRDGVVLAAATYVN
ncbi:MAG: VWA domain-containing protein [Vicinamibacterales bacterium]